MYYVNRRWCIITIYWYLSQELSKYVLRLWCIITIYWYLSQELSKYVLRLWLTGDAEQVIRLGYPPSPHQTQRSGDVQTLSTAHQRYLEVEDQKILRTHHPISGASPSHQNSTNSQVHASRGTRGAVMSNSTVRHCNLSLSRNCCLDERQSRHLHAKPINTA